MANEMRLIDANALIDAIERTDWYHISLQGNLVHGARSDIHTPLYKADDIYNALNDAPSVDAVEVVHGEWSTIEDDYTGLTALQCSECNQEYWFEDDPPMKIYNYCPNCGAKMDGGSHETD